MHTIANKIKRYVEGSPQIFVTDGAFLLASLRHAPEMAELIAEVKRAFKEGIPPEYNASGTTPTYFLHDCDGNRIAVFKLEYYWNEYTAFRLDHESFAGVPPTVITTLEHPLFGRKMGSCQLFIPDATPGVALWDPKFAELSPSSLRRIAVLDIRLMNGDRHSSNVLVVNQNEMIPIDHAFIFPGNLKDTYLGWTKWSQAQTHFSEEECSYIARLDPEEDHKLLLKELHFEELFANRLFIATVFLKLAVIQGWSPQALGQCMVRSGPHDPLPSPFEDLVEKIQSRGLAKMSLFSRFVYDEVNRFLDHYAAD